MRRIRIAMALMLIMPGMALGTVGARALSQSLSARQMGMGDLAIGGSDVLRSWTNPALLAWQTTQGELAANASSLHGDSTLTGVGGGWKANPNLTLGVMMFNQGVSFDSLDADGKSSGSALIQQTSSGGVSAAWAGGLWSAGATLKAVSDKVADSTASTIGADLGGSIHYQEFEAGLALRNAGAGLAQSVPGYPAETLPTEIRAGAGWKFGMMNGMAGVEYSKLTDRPGRIGLGAVIWPVRMFGIRAGATTGDSLMSFTAGLSFVHQSLGIDYALVTHPLGMTHRVCLSYTFENTPASPAPESSPETAPEPAKKRRATR